MPIGTFLIYIKTVLVNEEQLFFNFGIHVISTINWLKSCQPQRRWLNSSAHTIIQQTYKLHHHE